MALTYNGNNVSAVNYNGQQVKEVKYNGQTVWTARFGDAKLTIENLGGTRFRQTFEWTKEVNNDRQAIIVWTDDAGFYEYTHYLSPGQSKQVIEDDFRNMYYNLFGQGRFYELYWAGDGESKKIMTSLIDDGARNLTSTYTYITK